QLVGLVLDCRDDLRVAVPGRGNGDAGGAVEEQVAVNVLNDRAATAFDDQRVDARVRRPHVAGIALQQCLPLGAGQPGPDVRYRLVLEQPHDTPPVWG